MPMSDFWGKKDNISLARSLRLATIKNVLDQGLISQDEARELLCGELTRGKPATFFDDSDCLKDDREKSQNE